MAAAKKAASKQSAHDAGGTAAAGAVRAGQDQSDTANADGSQPAVVAGITAPHIRRADAPFSTQQLLPPSGAPPAQMVKVKEKATGRVFAAWPVDARELVTHPNQEHEYAEADEPLTPRDAAAGGNPTPVAPVSANSPIGVDPVAPVTPPREGAAGAPGSRMDPAAARAALEDRSKSELQDLARRSGIDPDQTKDDLVNALHPHAVVGTVALSGPTPLAPTPRRA